MKKLIFVFIGLVLSTFSVFCQKVNKEFIDGEIYIKLKELKSISENSKNINLQEELSFLSRIIPFSSIQKSEKPFYTSKSTELQKIYRLKINTKNLDELILALKNQPDVAYAEKIPLRFCIGTPNDEQVGSQWSLPKIKAFQAWDITTPTRQIKIAIVDNAFQTNHPDLANNMLAGYDISDNDNDPNPINANFNHGTHVAGIAGGVTNNNLGIASASNNSAKIIPIKATPDTGNPRGIYHGYEGITWAADNGADIISLSWGGFGFSQTEQEVINYAASKGCVIVAAAGNENMDTEVYPGAYENVISVASLDADDTRSSFSSYGTWVDISAPGRGILSTLPFNTYGSFNGTSMATPLVSACLAYVWACSTSLTPTALESLIKHTTDDISAQNPTFLGKLGTGRINLLKAVACSVEGIPRVSISSLSTPYICQGETVELSANALSGANYIWYKNNVATAIRTQNIIASEAGDYKVLITKNSCEIISDIQKVNLNTLKTPSATVNSLTVPYCSNLNTGFIAQTQTCNFSGPTTFTYAGGMVGYDAFEKSGADPSIIVSNIGGLLTNVWVSITWQKKDQGNENTCGSADGGAVPFNEEVSFKLQSPSGKIITLLATGTYARGTTTSGIVTTIFKDGATPIPANSVPQSGTFVPNQALSAFLNEIPNGKWTLLPQDDSFGDPLCVSGFSITVSSNAGNTSPSISWWDEGGNLLKNGNDYLPPTNKVEKKVFYVETRCNGLCPSERVQSKFVVKPIPEVVIFPVSSALAATSPFKNFVQTSQLNYTKNQDGTYSIFDESKKNNDLINIGEVSPLTNPVTLCSTNQSYLLMALGCSNTITWSYGENGQSLLVSPTSTIGYSAYCHQDWGSCPPIISNIIHFISTDHHNYPIVEEVAPNNRQTFVQNHIIASNIIQTPAIIEYRGIKSVELNPGFQVSGNSIFKAEIKGCGN